VVCSLCGRMGLVLVFFGPYGVADLVQPRRRVRLRMDGRGAWVGRRCTRRVTSDDIETAAALNCLGCRTRRTVTLVSLMIRDLRAVQSLFEVRGDSFAWPDVPRTAIVLNLRERRGKRSVVACGRRLGACFRTVIDRRRLCSLLDRVRQDPHANRRVTRLPAVGWYSASARCSDLSETAATREAARRSRRDHREHGAPHRRSWTCATGAATRPASLTMAEHARRPRRRCDRGDRRRHHPARRPRAELEHPRHPRRPHRAGEPYVGFALGSGRSWRARRRVARALALSAMSTGSRPERPPRPQARRTPFCRRSRPPAPLRDPL